MKVSDRNEAALEWVNQVNNTLLTLFPPIIFLNALMSFVLLKRHPKSTEISLFLTKPL